MKILHIPCLDDNYTYLIIDEASSTVIVVDLIKPKKIITVANKFDVDIKMILTTHQHEDHAGGNDQMKTLILRIKVYGGSINCVQGCTDEVRNGDNISLGEATNILALHTLCHTKGHISYYVTSKVKEVPTIFTGDTLFVAGCGKFFEGTAEQMYQSLCVTLGSLSNPTRVYCGHEYTEEKKLMFASTVEPKNENISQKLVWAKHQCQANLPMISSTIAEEFETNLFIRVDLPKIQANVGSHSPIEAEFETNLFIRVDLPKIQANVGSHSPIEALGEIRKLKDNWRVMERIDEMDDPELEDCSPADATCGEGIIEKLNPDSSASAC